MTLKKDKKSKSAKKSAEDDKTIEEKSTQAPTNEGLSVLKGILITPTM